MTCKICNKKSPEGLKSFVFFDKFFAGVAVAFACGLR